MRGDVPEPFRARLVVAAARAALPPAAAPSPIGHPANGLHVEKLGVFMEPDRHDLDGVKHEVHYAPRADARQPDAAKLYERQDAARRRRSKREGRERGCWIYIPAQELLRAGIDPTGPPPFYRTWGARRGSVLLRLYRDA